jgi:hypothetical protein
MAQRRSVEAALDYVRGLASEVTANCWSLAEAAGHENPYRMQALLSCYRWDWTDLRAELPALARAWLPCDEGDLTGPGIAVDETAQLKDGDATACVAPQHAGCTGHVENCLTTVFAAWVTTSGQAWADFDVFMPGRWEKDWRRRRAARIPDKVERKTKPRLAIDQIGRLLDAGLPARWAAFDEVYGRSGELRRFCESRGLAYVAVIPRDFRVTLPSGTVIKAEDAAGHAVFEQRSCGNGAKGPRLADWALTATASPRHVLLIRRLISRPDDLTFPPALGAGGHPGDHDVLHHRRRPQMAGRLCGDITLPDAPAGSSHHDGPGGEDDISGADLRIPLGDAPVPACGGQPCPPGIAAIRLTIAETARIERLARQHAGLITRARLAFHLRWSRWRRRHQARARWHHYATRLAAVASA